MSENTVEPVNAESGNPLITPEKQEVSDQSITPAEEIEVQSELAEEEELNIPKKDFYVQFRIMMKPFPNEHWSDWFFYPSGADLKNVREAVKNNAVLFVDDIDEVKDAIRLDTMLNAKFLDLPNDVISVRQDSQRIKNDLGFGPWDKIPARFAQAIQIRLMNNDIADKLKPRTIKDLYEDMTGLSATKEIESKDADIDGDETYTEEV